MICRCGSSPPTRGTLSPACIGPSDSRFIPAHAGNTTANEVLNAKHSVHPRPRGEHVSVEYWGTAHHGSSPPTRGTRAERSVHALDDRFIPAHAGNTRRNWRPRRCTPVHPRPRGEHDQRGGKALPRDRFIPAHAGNTTPSRRTRTSATVHPRPRGEHAISDIAPNTSAGSSPPTRGTHLAFEPFPTLERFIPAHAGNTMVPCSTQPTKTVHPRPRGEHSREVLAEITRDGSSPPTRGTRSHPMFVVRLCRFIPAHAGNTWKPNAQKGALTVHPRPRGEHTYRKPLIQKQKIGPQKSTDLPPGKSSRQCLTARSRRSTPPCRRSPPRPARGYRSRSPGTAC